MTTLCIERVLTQLAKGTTPKAGEVMAALEELRRIQMADVRRDAAKKYQQNTGWTPL